MHSCVFLVTACVQVPVGYTALEQTAVVITALQVDFSSAALACAGALLFSNLEKVNHNLKHPACGGAVFVSQTPGIDTVCDLHASR